MHFCSFLHKIEFKRLRVKSLLKNTTIICGPMDGGRLRPFQVFAFSPFIFYRAKTRNHEVENMRIILSFRFRDYDFMFLQIRVLDFVISRFCFFAFSRFCVRKRNVGSPKETWRRMVDKERSELGW